MTSLQAAASWDARVAWRLSAPWDGCVMPRAGRGEGLASDAGDFHLGLPQRLAVFLEARGPRFPPSGV